jgi:hypothetical protein
MFPLHTFTNDQWFIFTQQVKHMEELCFVGGILVGIALSWFINLLRGKS